VNVSKCSLFDKKTALFITFILLMSATSFNLLSEAEATQAESILKKSINKQPQPKIYFYSSVEKNNPDENSVNMIYHFNGADLDGKPTFYKNELIPFGWKVLEQKTINDEQTFIITKNRKKASLLTYYSASNTKYATKRIFKMARLKHALTGNKKSKLYWSFQYCNNKCVNN